MCCSPFPESYQVLMLKLSTRVPFKTKHWHRCQLLFICDFHTTCSGRPPNKTSKDNLSNLPFVVLKKKGGGGGGEVVETKCQS